MDTPGTRKQTKLFVVLISALVAIFFIVAVLTAQSVIAVLRSTTALNPTNFDDANREFFNRLAENKIEILSFSSEEPLEVEQFGFKVAIVPLERDTKRIADQDNKKAHANGAVLIFACHELLHGNKELGRRLLDLLKQHDQEIRYSHPTGKEGLLGDTGANIYIEELLRAADRLVDDDLSEKHVLEEPASQYDWRKNEYASPNTEKQEDL